VKAQILTAPNESESDRNDAFESLVSPFENSPRATRALTRNVNSSNLSSQRANSWAYSSSPDLAIYLRGTTMAMSFVPTRSMSITG